MLSINENQPLPLMAFLDLIYGKNPNFNQDIYSELKRIIGGDFIKSISDMRAITMRLDRQSFPTPALFRFDQNDISFVKINDFNCPVDRHDFSVALPAANNGFYEPHLVDCFKKLIRPNDIIFDIGANLGFHTFLFSKLIGADGRCFAFEPNSENCRNIILGCEYNKINNITLFSIALSDVLGWVYFSSHIGSNGGFSDAKHSASQGYGSVVQTFTLDGLKNNIPDPDFIKIDVEGAEYKSLRGGQIMIARSRPIIVAEFSMEMTQRISQIPPSDYLNWIVSLGYEIFIINKSPFEFKKIIFKDNLIEGWGDLSRIEDLLFIPVEKKCLLSN